MYFQNVQPFYRENYKVIVIYIYVKHIYIYIYQHTGDFKFVTRQCGQEFEEEVFTGINCGALSGKQSGNICQNESNLLTQHLHSVHEDLVFHMQRVTVPLTNTVSLVLGEHSETISKSYSLSKEL